MTINEVEAAAHAVLNGHPPTDAQRVAAYTTLAACRLAREASNDLQVAYVNLQRA